MIESTVFIMRKIFLSLLVLVSLFGLRAAAADFVVDGISYAITSATEKTVEVCKPTSGSYAIANLEIPATVTNGGVTYQVTGIGAQVFMSNATLTTVKMANSITYIGDKAFFSATKITSIQLSDSIRKIGLWGLRALNALTELELPEALESIPVGMCWGNTKLKGITIPDRVKFISENAFASCSALDTIQLGASVDSLAQKAFAYVGNTKKLICRAPVPPVCGEKALGNIKVATCPLYVREKSLAAYQKTAPWSTFAKILPYDPSGSLDDKLFVVAGIGYEMLSKENKTVGVAKIDTLVYTGEINIRPTVNYAGEEFKVIAVQAKAFKDSKNVTLIGLPTSVETLGDEAFSGCSGLKYMIANAVTPPACGTNVFAGINLSNCKLYAAAAGKDSYKTAAQWKDFTNRSIVIEEATVNGLSYKCNNVINSTLDFTGAKGFKGDLVIPDEVMIEGYPFYVTNIAGNSFYNTDITALTLPKTLKTISGSAFFTLGAYNRPIERIVVPEGVTYIGNNAFYGSHVNYVELPKKSLTELSSSAFYSCDIKGIEIPGSVGVVRASTFYGSKMNWVILGEGITEIQENAFWATNIGSLKLPSTMKKIGNSAFGSCSILSSLTINKGLESVADNAFDNCNSLYKVFSFATAMPAGLETALVQTGAKIGSSRVTYSVSDLFKTGTAFGTVKVRSDLDSWFDADGVKYLPTKAGSTTVAAVDGSYITTDRKVKVGKNITYGGKNYTVESVANYLLCGQTFMTDLDYSYPSESVPAGLAYNAKNLKRVILPASVKAIGAYSFASTDSLDRIDLPEGLETIGLASFYYSGLKELTVPANVTLMDNASVSGCKRLSKLIFKDGTKSILLGFMPTMFGNRPLFTGSKLNTVVIGRNLDYYATANYGYSPFYGDSIMEHLELTDIPNMILANAFNGCKSLKTLKIGEGMKKIGSAAFLGCESLDSIYIGGGLGNIASSAFGGCKNVTKFYCGAVVPPTCENTALTDIDKQKCTLYVPQTSIAAYKAANQWKDFFKVEGHGFVEVDTLLDDAHPDYYVVYNMNGVLILQTADAARVQELPAGLYIINGKKVMKR